MPPRLNLFTAHKAVPIFRQASTLNRPQTGLSCLNRRYNSSDSKHPKTTTHVGPTQDPLPDVRDEAEALEKASTIEKEKRCDGIPASPELEQGSPVSDILQRDEEARKHMPKVMQEQVKNTPSGSRSFSTYTKFAQEMMQQNSAAAGGGKDPSVELVANMITDVSNETAEKQGLKFPAPDSLPATENFRERYDSVLKLFTNMIMTSGKLTRAQRNMSIILDQLRTAPAPQPHPRRRLVASPNHATLPLNPVQYLNIIVNSVAPLLKIKSYSGLAGGGKALAVPEPLRLPQRRRLAIKWIIDASQKRRDSNLANRVAQEIVAVAEGRSSVWDRREQLHKIAMGCRANLALVEIRSAMRRK